MAANAASLDTVDPLPYGWVELQHESGIPVYFHFSSKVVTWTRPYKLEDDNVEKHHPKLTTFQPSLNLHQPVDLNSASSVSKASKNLYEIVEKVFNPSIQPTVPGWEESLKAVLSRQRQNDIMSDIRNSGQQNLEAVQFLTDYTTSKFGVKPSFEMLVTKNNTYKCKALIDGVTFGQAECQGKKVAIQCAAEAALEKIFPGSWSSKAPAASKQATMEIQPNVVMINDESSTTPLPSPSNNTELSMEEFRKLGVTDRRVYEHGHRTPLSVLNEMISKRPGMELNWNGDMDAQTKEAVLTGSIGPHVATVSAKSKKLARQFAAQELMALLRPEVELYVNLAAELLVKKLPVSGKRKAAPLTTTASPREATRDGGAPRDPREAEEEGGLLGRLDALKRNLRRRK